VGKAQEELICSIKTQSCSFCFWYIIGRHCSVVGRHLNSGHSFGGVGCDAPTTILNNYYLIKRYGINFSFTI